MPRFIFWILKIKLQKKKKISDLQIFYAQFVRCSMLCFLMFSVIIRQKGTILLWYHELVPLEKRSLSNKNRLRESPEELFPRGSFFIVFTHGASILPLIFTFVNFLECFVRKCEVRLRRPFCRDRRRFSEGRSQNLRPSPRIIASLSTQ